jgi:hypothetical protein
MSGDVLTTTSSIGIRQLVQQFLLRVLHRADAIAGKGVDEGPPAQACDLRPAALGDSAELVPLDGSSNTKLDNNGSRGLRSDGWFASTFGPLTSWLTVSPGLATSDSSEDVWEFYDLTKDSAHTVPAAFTASETFDVGTDLGSPVSLDYFDRRQFPFDGRIDSVIV